MDEKLVMVSSSGKKAAGFIGGGRRLAGEHGFCGGRRRDGLGPLGKIGEICEFEGVVGIFGFSEVDRDFGNSIEVDRQDQLVF